MAVYSSLQTDSRALLITSLPGVVTRGPQGVPAVFLRVWGGAFSLSARPWMRASPTRYSPRHSLPRWKISAPPR